MKSSKIAARYGLSPYDLDTYLKKQTKIPIKENFKGELIIPDDADIPALIAEIQEEKEKNLEIAKQREQEDKQREAQERIDKMNREQAEREEKHRLRINNLKNNHYDGYYEYKVISLSDISGLFRMNSGRVNTAWMTEVLNEMGLDGWHLITAYSNELGKNALSGGSGGVALGMNSTVDENILIFERFIRFIDDHD